MENILGSFVKARWSAANSGRRIYLCRDDIKAKFCCHKSPVFVLGDIGADLNTTWTADDSWKSTLTYSSITLTV